VLTPSEESRVPLEESWDVGMLGVQGREMQGGQLVLLIPIVRSDCRSDFEGILTPSGRLGRRRPEGDVPASFGDDGDASSLAGGV